MSTMFVIKSSNSATDRLLVVKFHVNIANAWLFMIQPKSNDTILHS